MNFEFLVKDLVDGVEKYIRKIIISSDVFFIFDRYSADSKKSITRIARVSSFCRSHQLSSNRKFPPKGMCLNSTVTKVNLIGLISGELFERFENNMCDKRLVITSKSLLPEEIHHGVRIKRHDLGSYYDEADYSTRLLMKERRQ